MPRATGHRRPGLPPRSEPAIAWRTNVVEPVRPSRKLIVTTFWGQAWSDHLESHSDYANRLPRGRTYVRNGSVIDLQIEPARITAIVSGSEVYDITINIKPLDKKKWLLIKQQCAGKVASLIELLQGKLSNGVMAIITDRDGGLFPSPKEIEMRCSCPDSAYMCKHLAAVMYGVGARLDEQPEILFTLRKVDQNELIDQAGSVDAITRSGGKSRQTLAADQVSDVFGIELDDGAAANVSAAPSLPPKTRPADVATKKTAKRKSKPAK